MNLQLIILLVCVGLISIATGDDIVKRLTKRYYDVNGKCSHRGKSKPAYECSGIMIRGVGVGGGITHAWDMKPMNVQKGSFSLSYLREDQQFTAMRGTGYILYPHLKTPKKKNTYKVYCAFPTDGWTDFRSGHGCGKKGTDASTNHCDRLNIKTFNDWLKTKNTRCAFDMTKKSAAKYFDICLKARTYLKLTVHNELKMHAWTAKPKKLPIEAFWYTHGSAAGKAIAKQFQNDFDAHGGGKVPVVAITFPTATTTFKVEEDHF